MLLGSSAAHGTGTRCGINVSCRMWLAFAKPTAPLGGADERLRGLRAPPAVRQPLSAGLAMIPYEAYEAQSECHDTPSSTLGPHAYRQSDAAAFHSEPASSACGKFRL